MIFKVLDLSKGGKFGPEFSHGFVVAKLFNSDHPPSIE